MRLTCEDCGPATILCVQEPRLDSAIASEFRDMAREMVRDGPETYVVDLSHVMFIDSSGVGALVGLLKYIGRDRRLELCGLNAPVLKVFKLTRLDTVFPISDSVETFLRTLATSRVSAS